MTPIKQRSFHKQGVIEFYRKDKFLSYPEYLLMDFLPTIYNYDKPILNRWRNYFKSIGVPYAVTCCKKSYNHGHSKRMVDRFVLWKRARA